MQGVQLTWHLPGQSLCPNGQRSGLFSNREADTGDDHAQHPEDQTDAMPKAASSTAAALDDDLAVNGD